MTLDVFADIACPWCYIGEANLTAALAHRPGLRVERRWRPFQLQPDLPRTGGPPDFFERQFGSAAQRDAAFARVAEAGEAAGVTFDFSRLAGAPNTLDAHRLIALADAHQCTWAMVEALFAGYFAHGRDLNHPDDLVAIAGEAGVPEAAVRELLASDRYEAEIAWNQEVARRVGITGVPLYLFGEQFAVSGAQPVEALVQALDRAAEAESGGAVETVAAGPVSGAA